MSDPDIVNINDIDMYVPRNDIRRSRLIADDTVLIHVSRYSSEENGWVVWCNEMGSWTTYAVCTNLVQITGIFADSKVSHRICPCCKAEFLTTAESSKYTYFLLR